MRRMMKMKRSIAKLIILTIVVVVILLFGFSVSAPAADEHRIVTQCFEIGKYDPVVSLYDTEDLDQAVTIMQDGKVAEETSVELRYKQKSLSHHKYVNAVTRQRFFVSDADNGYYTIEEFGGYRILTSTDDGFIFDYPKRDQYGRFIIEDCHLYQLEWVKQTEDESAGWRVRCKNGEKLQIDRKSVFEIVQVNYSNRY